MATIVTHTESGRNYVLVGAGYGLWGVGRDAFFGKQVQQGEHALLFVADDAGQVKAIRPEDALVVSVDGHSPAHWLAAPRPGVDPALGD